MLVLCGTLSTAPRSGAGLTVPSPLDLFCLRWKWRGRSAVKITERMHASHKPYIHSKICLRCRPSTLFTSPDRRSGIHSAQFVAWICARDQKVRNLILLPGSGTGAASLQFLSCEACGGDEALSERRSNAKPCFSADSANAAVRACTIVFHRFSCLWTP